MLDFILKIVLNNSEEPALKVLEIVCTVLIIDLVLLSVVWMFYQKMVREKKEVEKLHQEDETEAEFYYLRVLPEQTLKKSKAHGNLASLFETGTMPD